MGDPEVVPVATDDFLIGGGIVGESIRSKDWSVTPLGPIESWPQSLRTTVSLCLASNFPIDVISGPEHIQITTTGIVPCARESTPLPWARTIRRRGVGLGNSQ